MNRSAFVLAAALFISNSAIALDREALFQKADQAYDAQNFDQALSWMTSLAVLGDSDAQNYVGYMHAYAKGTIRDVEKAATWYCRAALQGNAKSMANIARFYVDGTGVEPDALTANVWYTLAAQLGDDVSQVNLGMNHLDGVGTPEDAAQAYKWLSIALVDFSGKTLAHDYLEDAAKALSPDQLGALNSEVSAWKPGTFSAVHKTQIAQSSLCKSKDLDMKPLTFNQGSAALRNEDFDIAYVLFKTLADDDHAPSQMILAEMYEQGQGRAKDTAQATKWYCRAAGLGDQEALWRLAHSHPNEATVFHTIGANIGDERAQLALGRKALTTDPVQAYKWLSVASNENLYADDEAAELLDQLRDQMPREQKLEGINLAANFWPVQFSATMSRKIQTSKACSSN